MRLFARLIGFFFTTGAILFVLGAAGAAVVVWHYQQDLPDYTQLQKYEPPVMTRVHAGDGSLLAGLPRRNQWVFSSVTAIDSSEANAARRARYHAKRGTTPPRLVTVLRVPMTIHIGKPRMDRAMTHLFHRLSPRLMSTTGMHRAMTR